MLHITSLDDGLDIFKALGSDVRIEIIKLLIENKEMRYSIGMNGRKTVENQYSLKKYAPELLSTLISLVS